MANKINLTALAIAALTAAHGANIAEEHASAHAAADYLADNADEFCEVAAMQAHNANIEIGEYHNADDIACVAVIVWSHDAFVCDNVQGGDEIVACFAFEGREAAMRAAADLMVAVTLAHYAEETAQAA